MQFEWQRDNRIRLRLVLNGCDYGPMVQLMYEAKAWCKDSGIQFWDDSFFAIRFTTERDLSWFLLRYS